MRASFRMFLVARDGDARETRGYETQHGRPRRYDTYHRQE